MKFLAQINVDRPKKRWIATDQGFQAVQCSRDAMMVRLSQEVAPKFLKCRRLSAAPGTASCRYLFKELAAECGRRESNGDLTEKFNHALRDRGRIALVLLDVCNQG